MRILIVLALLGAVMAAPKQVTRIVGGEDTDITVYPYMANMQYGFFGVWWIQFCGGSLLTSTVVLSAAHCYIGDPASAWRVLLGTSYASSGGSEFYVSAIVIHESYSDATLDNDVALVRLSSSATYSDTIQPARIAGPNYILADGSPVTAIGWGSLQSGSNNYPEQLQHVEVNIINQELCVERYAYLKTQSGFQNWPDVTDGMLCVGILDVGGKDACQGDSGGPLSDVIDGDSDVIMGITSWGMGCGHPEYPGVNARVSFYADWIVANAN